jgi:hypothetical protein
MRREEGKVVYSVFAMDKVRLALGGCVVRTVLR